MFFMFFMKCNSSSRNPEIARGIRRFSHTVADHKRMIWKKAKLGAKGKKVPATKASPRHPSLTGRWYSTEDRVPLKRTGTRTVAKLRKSISAGTVAIILAGRFRGKRVIVLKQLPSGLLLVTGMYIFYIYILLYTYMLYALYITNLVHLRTNYCYINQRMIHNSASY